MITSIDCNLRFGFFLITSKTIFFFQKKVLVGLETGVVLQVECPDPGTVDSSVTYEISPTPEIKSYPFRSVKHKLAVRMKCSTLLNI